MLDDDTYDVDLIEELFNKGKKNRQSAATGQQIVSSQMTTTKSASDDESLDPMDLKDDEVELNRLRSNRQRIENMRR